MGKANAQVVWFKRDLRVRDHVPLHLAAKAGPVIPLYIVEAELWKQPDASSLHWSYLRSALLQLRESLTKLGAPLLVRLGAAEDVFAQLHQQFGIETVWSHEETGNLWTYDRDKRVAQRLRHLGISWREHHHDLVVRRLKSRDEWGAIAKARLAQPLARTPEHLLVATPLDGWSVEPGEVPERIAGCVEVTAEVNGAEKFGERAARDMLDSFLAHRSRGYEKNLSSPVTAWDGCSRLSTHLTYGTISLKEVMLRTRRSMSERPELRFSLRAYEERLHWRSHFVQKLEDEPSLENKSYVAAFDGIRLDPAASELGAARFAAWSTGQTGYPMVDACMRSLLATGWINFRMRALLVSFASYDLWLDWRATAPFLARTFSDYEPGIHYPQVQMQSGTTGINTIRIYDPVKQGLDHDPTGAFVRRWVPELADVGAVQIHQPWLGVNELWGTPQGYPAPIVDHAPAVADAWKHIDRIKSASRRNGSAGQVLEKHGSRRPSLDVRRAGVGSTSDRRTIKRSLFDDASME